MFTSGSKTTLGPGPHFSLGKVHGGQSGCDPEVKMKDGCLHGVLLVGGSGAGLYRTLEAQMVHKRIHDLSELREMRILGMVVFSRDRKRPCACESARPGEDMVAYGIPGCSIL